MPSRPGTHFNTGDYEAVGRHFCETLLDFSDPSLEKELLREKILQKLTDSGSNADEPVNVTVTDYSSLSHSDSEESIDGSNNKKSSDIPAINPLKRQASIRVSKKRPKPTIVVTASSASSTTIKLENQNQRTVFSLNKASVNTIKLGQRKASLSGLDDEISEDVEVTQKELAVFRRLTKFRRKAKVRDDSQNVTYMEKKETSFAYSSGPKCTSILFDDPFNPPGGMSSRKKGNTAEYMEDDFDNDSGSGTEDECNEKDGAIKNMSNFTQTLNSQDTLMNDCIDSFGRMRVFGFPDRATAVLAPFVPRLPQGKPPLQQMKTLYSSGISETKLNSQKNVQQPKKKSFDDEPTKKSQTAIQKRRASLATTTAVNTSSPSKHYCMSKPQRSRSGSLVAQTIGSKITNNRKEKDEKSGNTGSSNNQQQSSSSVSQKRSRFKHSKHSKKSS